MGALAHARFWPTAALLRTNRDEIREIDRRPVFNRIPGRTSEWSKRDALAGLTAARYEARKLLVTTSNLARQQIAGSRRQPSCPTLAWAIHRSLAPRDA